MSKWLTSLLMALAIFLTPLNAVAEDAGLVGGEVAAVEGAVPAVPDNFDGAAELVSQAINLAATGQWLLFAILLVQLGVFSVKRWAPEGYMKTWGSVTVGALAAVVAVLSGVLGGLSWAESLVVFLSGPGSSLIVDLGHATGLLKRKETAKDA